MVAAQSTPYTGHTSTADEQSQETFQRARSHVLGSEMCHIYSANLLHGSARFLSYATRVAGAENPSLSSLLKLLSHHDKG